MTNLEYLTLSLSPMGIEPQTIELLLKKGQLSPAGDLEIARCDRAIYRYFYRRCFLTELGLAGHRGLLHCPMLRTGREKCALPLPRAQTKK